MARLNDARKRILITGDAGFMESTGLAARAGAVGFHADLDRTIEYFLSRQGDNLSHWRSSHPEILQGAQSPP